MITKNVKNLKNIKKIFLWMLLSCTFLSNTCFATEEKENMYLKQIYNQLDAIQPLIIAAEKSQPTNLREPFHYTQYKDKLGKTHHGLLEDVQAIKSSIHQKLNHINTEPRTVKKMIGDYQ